MRGHEHELLGPEIELFILYLGPSSGVREGFCQIHFLHSYTIHVHRAYTPTGSLSSIMCLRAWAATHFFAIHNDTSYLRQWGFAGLGRRCPRLPLFAPIRSRNRSPRRVGQGMPWVRVRDMGPGGPKKKTPSGRSAQSSHWRESCRGSVQGTVRALSVSARLIGRVGQGHDGAWVCSIPWRPMRTFPGVRSRHSVHSREPGFYMRAVFRSMKSVSHHPHTTVDTNFILRSHIICPFCTTPYFILYFGPFCLHTVSILSLYCHIQ